MWCCLTMLLVGGVLSDEVPVARAYVQQVETLLAAVERDLPLIEEASRTGQAVAIESFAELRRRGELNARLADPRPILDDYSPAEEDPHAAIRPVSRLVLQWLLEQEDPRRAMETLVMSLRDMSTASWPRLARAAERAAGTMIDGGRVYVDAARVPPIFQTLAPDQPLGLHDHVIALTAPHERYRKAEMGVTWIAPGPYEVRRGSRVIDTFAEDESVHAIVAEVALRAIGAQVHDQVQAHVDSVRKVRDKRDP